MSLSPFSYLDRQLQKREEKSLTRERTPFANTQGKYLVYQGKHFLNFSSNDYLGMRAHPHVQQAWIEGLAKWGISSSASALITGYTDAHRTLEKTLCKWLDFEDVLLFSSGFLANQTVLFTLLNSKHTLWQDKFNHASLQEAGYLCLAQQQRFAHNNLEHLQKILKPQSGLIVSEGVFSMDGDQAPLQSLIDLAKQSDNALMLDDAHGLGVFGTQGRGTPNHQSVHIQDLDLYLGTFSKALGGCGAFVGGKHVLIESLRQFGRGYIYSTHMSSAQAQALTVAIKIVQQADIERARLQSHLKYLQNYFQEKLSINGPIIPVILKEPNKALAACMQLKQHGLWCQAIRPPTVPTNTSRLRITLSAAHTSEDVKKLAQALEPFVCM